MTPPNYQQLNNSTAVLDSLQINLSVSLDNYNVISQLRIMSCQTNRPATQLEAT